MEQWQVGPIPDYIYGNSTNHPNDVHAQHPYQQHINTRRNDQMDFRSYGQQPSQTPGQPHHPGPVQPPMNVAPQHAPQHAQHPSQSHSQQHPQPPSAQQSQSQSSQPHAASAQASTTPTAPAPASTPVAQRARKRPNPATAQSATASASPIMPPTIPSVTPSSGPSTTAVPPPTPGGAAPSTPASTATPNAAASNSAKPSGDDSVANPTPPPAKKSRTNTPWTPAEEHRLKQMRDAGSSWAEIAKTFPARTEGSVKKHWYKDMHYAEFAEDESAALLNAIKEYENQKWKVIGQKVGKPAKACEQYAKEHFPEQVTNPQPKR